MSSLSSSSFPFCFRSSHTFHGDSSSSNPNLATYLYHTHLGAVSLTWSRSILGRSLHLHLHHSSPSSPSPSTSSSSFQLHIKPFLFWKKQGSKKISPNTHIFWNISKAKFGSGPEPLSGYYVAVVVDKKMILLVGDSGKDAYARTKAGEPQDPQSLILKREHVVVDKVYTTRAKFGGRTREIQIDFSSGDDSRLCFSVDSKIVLQIKRLKWKFRGNERVEVDSIPIQISWDVYNWLFHRDTSEEHAIFVFKFEEEEDDDDDDDRKGRKEVVDRSLMSLWTQQNWNMGASEWGKTGKSFSSSSVSMSSSAGSFGATSSVQEWSSMEENELVVPIGFSLLVYAWRS